MLYVIVGDSKYVNFDIMMKAFESDNSFILDCANCMNPHKIIKHVPLEKFTSIKLIIVELLYTFRDALIKLNQKREYNLFITTPIALFNYQDEVENNQIYSYCWKLLKSYSKKKDVYVGLEKGSKHEHFANLFADKIEGVNMGHTAWSQRMNMDLMISELKDYAKTLEDRETYYRLLKKPLKYYGSISYANSVHAWAFLLLSIMVEQEKEIKVLKNDLNRYISSK